jgi:histone-lysine N-methyltransferase SETMAR
VGTIEHLLHSPDLAPSDFHLFGLLKTHLGGRHFSDDEEVKTGGQKWLKQQAKDFYDAGFDILVKRWDKCIDVGGGYIKK